MTQSLHNRILNVIHTFTRRHPGAWIAWCDPEGMWIDLLRFVLRANEITLVEVHERTAGHLGGLVARKLVQEHIESGKSFVLHLTAASDDLGWMWAQALRAEHIYSRTLRDQLSEWGWRPYALDIEDDELKLLAQQNLAHNPATWGSGGVEPDLDLLLRKLVYATSFEPMEQVLLKLSAERAGLPEVDLEDLAGWRTKAIAHLLVTDAHQHVPDRVPATHDLVIQPPARTLALRLIDTWLDSHALCKELPRAIAEAETIAALDTILVGLDATSGPFVSRRAEQMVFVATCDQLAQLQGRALIEKCAALHPAIRNHSDHVWAQEGRVGEGWQLPWSELSRLSQACVDLQAASPATPWDSPTAAIEWYTTIGWQVDRAGEALLRNLASTDARLVTVLTPLREAFRARWEQQLMQWSSIWQGAGCPVPPLPTAGEQLRTILNAHRATAIIIVDALRYDLGTTLANLINESETTERATVLPARAPLPTITALGMGQALPIAESELQANVVDGKWMLQAEGESRNLSIAAKRREWWITHGHVPERALLTVPQALNTELPTPERSCPRLVIYDDAIDALGHDEELEAVGAQDVLRRYLQVIQRVRDAGWRRIAVVTDHGYIHWSGTYDQRVQLPVSNPMYASRRACAFPAETVVQTSHGFAPGGSLAVAVPSGIACFSAYGKRGYFHGGASLQEWIIPVILIDWPARARPVEVQIRGIVNVLSQRPRVTLDIIATTLLLDEMLAREVEVVIRDATTRMILFESQAYSVKPTDISIDVMLKIRAGAAAPRNTQLVIEVRDPHTEAVIAHAQGRLLIDLDSW